MAGRYADARGGVGGEKLVEAPGVEGRGDGSGFEGLREDSSGEAGDSAGLAAGGAEVGGASSGLAELRCSSEGSRSPACRPNRRDSPALGLDGPGEGAGRECDVRRLKGRLLALEHILKAVGALLEAGAIREALALLRSWQRPE